MQAELRQPLADRMRPHELTGFQGQHHLLSEGMPLRLAIEQGRPHSMVLWGAPGSGKTTLARLVAKYCQTRFVSMTAISSGTKEIRAAMAEAREQQEQCQQSTILFVDEVHRFNKAQQDAFLPFVEDGTVIFIGATTENPSFELNDALLSRLRVYVLQSLEAEAMHNILRRAMADGAQGLADCGVELSAEQLDMIVAASDGDARNALNFLETTCDLAAPGPLQNEMLQKVLAGGTRRRFDKRGDIFYDQISALHKSVRGSAPDASLYWFARILDGGCDPLYVARRVVRIASEDIGNADPRGLTLALHAWDVQQRLGSPEGELAIAQAIVYLACAAKSNAVYRAWQAAFADAKKYSHEVPLHLRNAPTRLTKKLGHGEHYRYAHDEAEGYAAGERYFPEAMGERQYYYPTTRGLEIRIAEKLKHLRELDARLSNRQ